MPGRADIGLAALIVVATVMLLGRAIDDARSPKMVLIRDEWVCSTSHVEMRLTRAPATQGGVAEAMRPETVCDLWARR